MFQFYGDPTPEAAPPAVSKVIRSIVQWFVDSGTTSDLDGAINDSSNPLWLYVFQVIYWIIVWSILATFLSTLVAGGFFFFPYARAVEKNLRGQSCTKEVDSYLL